LKGGGQVSEVLAGDLAGVPDRQPFSAHKKCIRVGKKCSVQPSDRVAETQRNERKG
jgi:hypothetical protein